MSAGKGHQRSSAPGNERRGGGGRQGTSAVIQRVEVCQASEASGGAPLLVVESQESQMALEGFGSLGDCAQESCQ